MKKLLLLVVLAVLLVMTTSVALAGGKDDHVKVGFFDGACTINAGEWGWIYGADAWIATYANDVQVLKCIGYVDNPPDELVVIKPAGGCVIPGGFTENSKVQIFPDGQVRLTCKFAP